MRTGIFVRDALPFEFYRVDFFSCGRFLHTKLFVVVVVVVVIIVFDRTSVREGLATREVAKNVEYDLERDSVKSCYGNIYISRL